MDLKNREWFQELFSTSGRRGRQEFICMAIVLAILSSAIGNSNVLSSLIFPYFFPMCFAYTNIVKRLHDLNYSGYWAGIVYICYFAIAGIGPLLQTGSIQAADVPKPIFLFMFGVVILGSVIGMLLLTFKKGIDGDNKYGPDPLKRITL